MSISLSSQISGRCYSWPNSLPVRKGQTIQILYCFDEFNYHLCQCLCRNNDVECLENRQVCFLNDEPNSVYWLGWQIENLRAKGLKRRM